MSNELTDVRCPCGADYPADSYDAGFIAGSGMCQNCDAALPPKDICTCPSGDGSLRHPCPAHPAVEQAGANVGHGHVFPRADGVKMRCGGPALCSECAADAYRARAALAHRAPEVCSECSDTGKVYDESGDGPWSCYACTGNPEVIGYANGDELDNMLDDRTAVLSPGKTSFHTVPVYRLIRAALAHPSPAQAEAERPELWAVHAQGPDELYAAFSREDAEKHAAELNALPMPEGIAVGAVVVPSPWPEAEHWKYLAEQEREHVDVARAGLTQPSPAQAEKAEVERTEGSADLLAIVREAVAGAYNEWKMISEAVTEIMEAHERIVGELRAENAKLSEDLNRLSIIRARLNLRLDFALDKISKLESRWPHGESPEERFEHYISNTIDRAPEPLRRLGNWLSHVLDEDQWTTAERMLTGACVAAEERAAAQTQHSVPEGWKPVPIEPLLNMMSDKDHDTRIMAERQLLSILADAPGNSVPQAWLDVQAERRRQITAEGWTPEHDDEHADGQMARAAACYALAGSSAPNDGTAALLVSLAWPWDEQWWKPSTARRDLVKACSLALAEIERLDRATATQGGPRDA